MAVLASPHPIFFFREFFSSFWSIKPHPSFSPVFSFEDSRGTEAPTTNILNIDKKAEAHKSFKKQRRKQKNEKKAAVYFKSCVIGKMTGRGFVLL
jgi:hypothetical protein